MELFLEGDDNAVAGVAYHLEKFWDPRMRNAIIEYVVDDGCSGLQQAVLKAIQAPKLKLPSDR